MQPAAAFRSPQPAVAMVNFSSGLANLQRLSLLALRILKSHVSKLKVLAVIVAAGCELFKAA
ncbi:MAG: hypothetical protein ACAH88_10790, partial [Roseimicrobium sp.]